MRIGSALMRLIAAITLSRDLPVLGIDHQKSVGTVQHADPAAGAVRMARIDVLVAGKHGEVRRDLLGDQLDLVVLDSLSPRS